MIKAKSITKDFWILQNNSTKVGEISNVQDKTVLSFKGKKTMFKTLDSLKKKINIEFIDSETKKTTKTNSDTVYGYPHSGDAFNTVWDLKLKLPLYTKKKDSKSLFAAGYYMVKINDKWREMQSPKLIILQRNEYIGPYKTSPTHATY